VPVHVTKSVDGLVCPAGTFTPLPGTERSRPPLADPGNAHARRPWSSNWVPGAQRSSLDPLANVRIVRARMRPTTAVKSRRGSSDLSAFALFNRRRHGATATPRIATR